MTYIQIYMNIAYMSFYSNLNKDIVINTNNHNQFQLSVMCGVIAKSVFHTKE